MRTIFSPTKSKQKSFSKDEQITSFYTDNVPKIFSERQAIFLKKLHIKNSFGFYTNA